MISRCKNQDDKCFKIFYDGQSQNSLIYAVFKKWFNYLIIHLYFRWRDDDSRSNRLFKIEQFLLNFVIDSINRRFIVYKKSNAIHQKVDQKISVFKIYLKEIKRELSSFDKYYKVILFLVKLISMLKNKLLIMKDVSNIKNTILFKTYYTENYSESHTRKRYRQQ